jgi:hypothetical protein
VIESTRSKPIVPDGPGTRRSSAIAVRWRWLTATNASPPDDFQAAIPYAEMSLSPRVVDGEKGLGLERGVHDARIDPSRLPDAEHEGRQGEEDEDWQAAHWLSPLGLRGHPGVVLEAERRVMAGSRWRGVRKNPARDHD